MATVEKLQSELSRVKAEEECKRVDYNHSREDLQETWDKLVSLRTHISYFNLVIEDTKVECIAAETNHPVYRDLEAITDGSINYSLHSASRVAAIQALKERIRVKEGLKARVVMLEQKLVESRKQLHVFSEALKNNSNVNFNSTSISSSLAAVGNVPQSLELRQIILQTSHHLEGNEKEYIRAKAELEMVELELSKALNSEENEEIFRMQAQSQSRGRFAQRNGVDKPITLSYADINRIGDIAYGRDISHTSDILPSLGLDSAQSALLGVSSPYTSTPGPRTQLKVTANYSTDKSMVDLISVGLPLSTDLIHAIRTGEIYNNTLEYLVNRHQIRCELTLYEALSGQARIRRMNGEPPKLFLDRLLRRRDSLLVLDTQLQAEVVERIETVKKMREIYRDAEIKRLRVELEISNREKSLKETEIKHMQYVYVIDKDSEKVEQQTLQEERKQSQIPLKSGSDVNAATPASVTHHTNSVNNIDDYSVNIASRNGENHFSDDSTTSSKLATRTSHNLESHKEQIHHLDHSSNRSYTSILKNSVNSTNEKFEDQSVDLSMSVSSAGESKSHYSQELHHNKVGTSSVHSTQTAESESRSIKNSIQRESTNASYRSTTNHAASISDSHRSHTLSLEMPTDLREREIFDRNRNQLIELMTQSEKAVIGERSIALAQSKKGTEDDLRHTLQLLQGNIGNKVQQSRKSSPSRLPYNPFEFEMVRKEIKVRVLSELLKRDLSLAELIQATSLLANKSTGMSGESDTSVTPLKILSSMLKRDLSLADLTDAATLIAHSREDKDKLLAALTADLGPSLPQLKNGDQDNIGNASITSDHSTSKTKSPELYDRYGRLLPEFRHLRSSNSSRGSNASSPNSSKAGPSQDSSPIRSSSPNGSRVYKAPPSSTQVKRNSRDSSGGIALADDLSVASMKSSSVQGNSVAFPSPLRTAGRCIACKDRRSHESSSVTSSQLSVSSSKQRKIVKHSGKCEMCGSAKVESSSQLYGDERGSAALTRSDLSATRYDDESESEDDRSKSVSFSIDSDPRSNSERESMIPRRSREKHRRSGSTNEISTQTTSVGSPRKSLFQGKDNRDSPIDAKRSLNYSNVGGKSPRAKFQDSLASSTGSADSYDKRKRTDRLEQQKVEIEELKKAQQQLMEMVMGFKNGSPGGNPKQSSDSQNPDIKNRGTFLLIPTESSPQILRSLSRSIDSAEKKGNEEQEDEIVSSSSSKRSPRSSRSIGRNRSEDHSADEISSKKGSLALSSSHDDLKKTNSDDYYKHSIEEDGLVEDHYDHNVHNEYGDYWREVVQFLRHRISRCLHRYDTAKMEERVDPLSGTVVSEDGRLSLAHMEVTVDCAKHLPVMKKLSKSADSFVEMMIVPERLFFDYQHDSRLVEEMMDNAAAYEREQELLKGMQAKALHPQYHQAAAKISGKVIHEVTGDAKYVRTSTQYNNLFPEWRESFKFNNLPIPTGSSSGGLAGDVLVVVLRDSSKMSQLKDEMIGYSVLPLSTSTLQDQGKHTMWLAVHPPSTRKLSMSRVAEDCVLKLEVKLFLSRQKLWADALRESEKLLVSVQSRKGPTHEELDRIKHLMSIEAGAARRRPSHDRESLREAPAKSYSGPHADWRSFPPQSSHSSHSRYHYNSQVRMNQVVGLREKPHPVRVPLEHELRNCNVYGIQSHIRNGSYPSGSRVGRGSIYVRAQRGEDPFRDSPSVRSNGGHSPPSRNPDHAYQYTGYDYRSPERYGTNGDRDDEEFGSTKRHRSEIDSNVSSDQIDMNLFRAAGGNRKSVSPSNNRSVYSDSKRKYAFGSYENRF